MAIRDGLTGFYNAMYVKARLQEEIDRSIRYKYPLSLLMINPDDFKALNDEFGQGAADQLLKSFSAKLGEIIRASDIVGRIGGDNFLVILPQTNILDAAAVAERIRMETALSDFRLVTRREKVSHFTISVGVYGTPLHKQTANEVIGLADAAVYRAKKKGKTGLSFISSGKRGYRGPAAPTIADSDRARRAVRHGLGRRRPSIGQKKKEKPGCHLYQVKAGLSRSPAAPTIADSDRARRAVRHGLGRRRRLGRKKKGKPGCHLYQVKAVIAEPAAPTSILFFTEDERYPEHKEGGDHDRP